MLGLPSFMHLGCKKLYLKSNEKIFDSSKGYIGGYLILTYSFPQVHYMYFAAFLFWVTGIVALIISLMTPPDEKHKVRNSLKKS